VGGYARARRRVLRQKQRQQHANGSRGAIGRDEERTDVEEDWMHQCQNTASSLGTYFQGLQGRVESGPLGRG